MKNLLILLLSPLILGWSCAESASPESSNCLSGVIIGHGCTNEGYLIEVFDLKGKEIEVGSVAFADKTYFNVIMSLELPDTNDWQTGDKLYFQISEIPVKNIIYVRMHMRPHLPII
ncbi:hypothetical protein [Pleomorphovibrio marinus]|uniref:hypothetical protein n=1 Tax=Pleomorphovibrio marinus TaxID=2164132 RepID=UPI000E0C7ABD|nr:hypothetical protein [Pleomorphovibrio marinus]